MYEPIAEHYEQIFPVSRAQVDFIAARTERSGGARLLDVGCAVGDLAAALHRRGFEVTGIDLNHRMIERARSRHLFDTKNRDLEFAAMDMRRLTEHFQADSFNTVCCLGNTLVHLRGAAEIESFLADTARLLDHRPREGKRGTLILQILNYEHLLKTRPKTLPPIETDTLLFERSYSYPSKEHPGGSGDAAGSANSGGGNILFSTKLTLKKDGRSYEDSIPLYPLLRGELQEMLQRQGFAPPLLFGSFDDSPLEPDSFPLIAVAELGD